MPHEIVAEGDERTIRPLMEHLYRALHEYMLAHPGEVQAKDLLLGIVHFARLGLAATADSIGVPPEGRRLFYLAAMDTFIRVMEKMISGVESEEVVQ